MGNDEHTEQSNGSEKLPTSLGISRIGRISAAPTRIICPQCVEAGKTSQVESLGATRTLLGFSRRWDEEGREITVDPNKTTEQFRCSEGHLWQMTY